MTCRGHLRSRQRRGNMAVAPSRASGEHGGDYQPNDSARSSQQAASGDAGKVGAAFGQPPLPPPPTQVTSRGHHHRVRGPPQRFKPTDLTIMRVQFQLHFENVACDVMCEVVISGALFLFLLRKHFITEFFFKKKSGDVNDEAILAFYFLLHKRAKHILPPYLSPPRANSNLNSPLTLHPPPTHPPKAWGKI